MAEKIGYRVSIKGERKSQRILAYGISELKDKTHFHQQEDLKDLDTFVVTKSIRSIAKEEPPEEITPILI